MKPHTPAATVTANSFSVNHKANHCHAKRALAACQASQKSFAEMLMVDDVVVWRLSVRLRNGVYKSRDYDAGWIHAKNLVALICIKL